ncbi:STAS domain-containing protein [Thermospira aquatica]|uniref:STAS domain-containing protein n=1 Tax=Thermospira aquatica TaxID=2828656 RepID=A0AAX3BFR3_9SPIR|nr:STAS domain-containing protein [Thermospira aquatica]URA11203.1 STAS domain-containing protein [Thermospira aquatica]
MESSKVYVGVVDRYVYVVKVIGRGTLEYSTELFETFSMKLDKNELKALYFDLSEAQYLDSSFIGVIVSLQKKMKKEKRGELFILNPSAKVIEIFGTMGLEDLLPMKVDDQLKNVEYTEEMAQRLEKTEESIRILLQSHQDLMEINPQNRRRFRLVEEMLKKELERFEK